MATTTPRTRTLFDHNMRQRVLTAIIAAPLALAMILLDWWTTALLIVLLLVLAAYEYIRLVRREPSSLWVNVGFGVVYLGAPLVAALWLRAHEDGVKWFLLVLAANWSTDTAALMVGKTIGKTPFAPRISPKKTWEGVIAGWITGFVATILFALLLDMAVDTAIVLLALLLPIAAILGDLLESKLKRRFHVKDSGAIFPGHGGVLDRIDGTLASLVVTAMIVALFA